MLTRRLLILTALVALASTPVDAQEPVASSKPATARKANKLAGETSPYLLLHAHNPVDWYPWGPEAFAKAKAENKPVFLSVGYSACYWCHVMERECFDNAAIAKLLNDTFICVKVDREERPDVDQIYMAALQAFGSGGWPMSMFLTPDGRPFFGGTYFPPADRDGMEGFPTLVRRVAEAWRDHRDAIERDADRLSALVRRALDGAAGRRAPLSRATARAGADALAEQFDPEYGGFGFNPENARRPKFPEPVNLVFLLDRHRRDGAKPDAANKTPGPLDMVLLTLDRMARGGIRDQLAGGYHRYATSRYWIVPHFEKMLYDNAQLASAHLLAFELTGDPRWRAEAEATFAFVARTMTAPDGGFYSALDAETGGEEGAYYVWTRDAVKAALADDPAADAFLQVYGFKRDPNFEKDRYVLLEPRTRAEQAATLGLTPAALETRLAPARVKLLAIRDRRPSPLTDDKILTSWNGLMIAAYADGHRVTKDPSYRAAAEKAADFVLTKLRAPDGRLLRTYRDGRAKLGAYLEDYAFLAHGLLRLHAATGDPQRLAQAKALTDRMIDDFADTKSGGFFYTADGHESLLARPKDPVDGVLPGGNSVAIRNLVALGVLTKEPRYLDLAGQALTAFSGRLSQAPAMLPQMLMGLQEYLDARPEAAQALAAVAVVNDDPALLGPVGRGSRAVVSAEAKQSGNDVTITLTIQPGWHIYAHPTGVDTIPPTLVTLEPGQGVKLLSVDYPPGVPTVLGSSGKDKVSVYAGTVAFKVRVGPDPATQAAPAEHLKFRVRVQACDDRACLAPAEVVVGDQ
jgi:uncharacterized protein